MHAENDRQHIRVLVAHRVRWTPHTARRLMAL
jgi:hypothetical protein